MRTCTKCHTEQQEDAFSWKKKDVRRNAVCKQCHKKYRDQHYLDNREQTLQAVKRWKMARRREFYSWLQTQACTDCGNDDFRVLEFDHLRDKKFDVSLKVNELSFERLMVEVEKCDIVCANCHRIRTALRGNQYSYLAT